MLRTVRQFYIVAFGLILAAGLALILVLIVGDTRGEVPKATLTYLPEGPGGFPQIALSFEGTKLPERNALEAAFEVSPPLSGDFSWNGSTLLFIPASRLLSDAEYKVRLGGGLKLVGGGRMEYGQAEWSFRTRPARIAYLKPEGRAVNLWLDEGTGSSPRQLTFETERRVLDFSVSPGGERIVYSLEEPDFMTASLWLVHTSASTNSPGVGDSAAGNSIRLVYEDKVRATAPRWSPGGDLIAYERRVVFKGGGFSAAQLWLVKADGTSLPPLYGGYQQVGVSMEWAAGGDKAFFWEPRLQSLGLFNFAGEPEWKALPGLHLASLAPSPDGREVIISRFDYTEARERQILWRLTATRSKSGTDWQANPVQIPTPSGYNDQLPSWSPDGRWITFIRQEGSAAEGKKSRLWLFDTQNGSARPLMEGEEILKNMSQGAYQWAFDGNKILFESYPTGKRPNSESTEIWESGLDGKNPRRLITGAFAPKWVI